MDEPHLLAAARYIALNPVRAGLVKRAEDWPWSSVRAHLAGGDDGLVTVAPLAERYPDFAAMLEEQDEDATAWTTLRKAETTGRPIGSAAWLDEMEKRTGRKLKAKPRGPRPKEK